MWDHIMVYCLSEPFHHAHTNSWDIIFWPSHVCKRKLYYCFVSIMFNHSYSFLNRIHQSISNLTNLPDQHKNKINLFVFLIFYILWRKKVYLPENILRNCIFIAIMYGCIFGFVCAMLLFCEHKLILCPWPKILMGRVNLSFPIDIEKNNPILYNLDMLWF